MRRSILRFMRSNRLKSGVLAAVSFVAVSARAEQFQLKCEEPIGPAADEAALKLTAAAEASSAVPTTAPPVAAVQTLSLPISKGRSLFVQLLKPSKAGMPTLLMMPGVNRNLLISEPVGVALARQGFGLVAFGLSTQPFSVETLPDGERPEFLKTSFSVEELASEVMSLAKVLKPGWGDLLPISLSYSGALSPSLTGFPLIIETVPMTSAAAANPQLEQYRQTLLAGELWNPIFGPGLTRSSLDAAYRQTWSPQVDAITKDFKLKSDRKADMIEGYTVMSRATEGFRWDVSKLPKGTRRMFILANNESPSLQKHQLETFQAVAEQRGDAVLFVMLESGHVVPAEQPSAYACMLKLAQAPDLKSGVIVVEPSTGKVTKFTGKDAEQAIARLSRGAL